MRHPTFLLTAMVALLHVGFPLLARAADQPPPSEIWLYYSTNLLVEANLEKAKDVWARAAKVGYTHVLLADSKFSRLGEMDKRYFANVERAKRLAADLKLTLVPALFPVGYSNDLLSRNPNLAEGLPVKEQPFVVKNGVAEPAASPAVAFTRKPAFADDSVSVDGNTATVKPDGKPANARLSFKLALSPFRCYHVSVAVKADG